MQTISKKSILNRICGVVVVLLLALTFALVGCSSNSNNNNAQSSNQPSAPAAEQKAPETITVNMTVTDLEGNVLYDDAVEVEPEATVFAVLDASGVEYVSETGSFGPYVTTIGDVAAGSSSGWTYTVNGEQPTVGADQTQVADGDTLAWEFVEF